MRSRRAIATAAILILLVVAGADSAAAQTPTAPVTVFGGGPTLQVTDVTDDEYDDLELTLTTPGSSEPLSDVESAGTPVWPDDAVIVATSDDLAGDVTRVVAGGAVSAEVASVELGFGGGFVLRLPTSAGEAYTGRQAGRIRFFLGEITLTGEETDDDPVTIRMLDASGAVIGVEKSPESTRSEPILDRRVGGAHIRVKAVLTSSLEAIALAPEHRAEELCVWVRVRSADFEPAVTCLDPYETMSLGGRRGCGPVPTTLAGFVPAGTQSLDLRLGSGRTVSLATRATAFGRPGRTVAAVLPRGEAVRSATARDAGGRTLARGESLVAPPDRTCPPDYRYSDWRFYGDAPVPRPGMPPGTELAAALPDGGPRLLVRDSGEALCLGFDQLDLDGGDCSPPPFSAGSSLFVDPRRGTVTGIYAARVAALDLRFRGGGGVRVPALDGVGYTGRYRGAVHFVLTPLPPGKTIIGATLLDAAGRDLGETFVEGPQNDSKLIGPPKTILAAGTGPARVRVVAGAVRPAFSQRKYSCIGLELGSERGDCGDGSPSVDDDFVTARVPCDRRRTVVFGTTRREVSRVDILLAGGRRVRAELTPFPRGLGGGGKVYLAVLGRRDAVTGVRFVGRPSRSVTLPGHAPDRQCGYETRAYAY